MHKILTSISFFLLFITVAAQNNNDEQFIRVRIQAAKTLRQITLIPETYGYEIFNDTASIAKVSQNVTIQLSATDSTVSVLINGKKDYGKHKRLMLKGSGAGDMIRVASGKDENTYYNNIEVYNRNGELIIINEVVLDYYIAGVIEAEGGFNANMEFYEVQAIIARTYTLSHLRRHEEEGFNLCDNVHCQVYPGRCKLANMLFAAITTKDLVIVDETSEYIAAAFHANCGGMTVNSEDVWSKPIPYLRAIRDTFCLNQFRATWEDKITVAAWESYLKKNGCKPDVADEKGLNFYQLNRKVYYENKGCKIPLKQIRADFNLRSTYFTMTRQGNEMLIKGRGSGHGVGLCQAGAKRMAELGYSAEEIINFYYKGVKLVNRKLVPVYYPKQIRDN